MHHDRALQRHIQNCIEIVVSDSAANETLAANMGRGRRQDPTSTANDNELLTPNLVLVGRDCAHAFRRPAAQLTGWHTCVA